MEPRWIIADAPDSAVSTALARELSIAPFLASLLCRKGLTDPVLAGLFLFPKLKSLGDPFLLPNMRAAVERILLALDRGERIVLYGDYDVDGVTSLALLTRVLRAFGGNPQCFLPMRMDEGYGLSMEGIERCLNTLHPQLLIALDCGTSSLAEIAHLQAQGVDVLVFDHHECKSDLPKCHALVNPKLGDAYHYLCSVGIVFKLCHALVKTRPLPDFDLKDYLDLVALGTVADLVPLQEENRILVQRGIRQMEQTHWIGLRILMEIAGVNGALRPSDIGFRLGPRLNAAGRLGTAEAALELLLTEDAGRARALAMQLDLQNRDRQSVERRILKEAEEMLKQTFNVADAAIVLGNIGWHPGVLGIVASRISKSYYRPTFIIGFDEQGLGKGSGRSIEGLSLVHSLTQCNAFLEKFGGHEMAAGLTMNHDRFEAFQRAFLDCARRLLTDEQLRPRLRLDSELRLSDLNDSFLGHHELMQPFGMGNHQPLFFARDVRVATEPRVLKEKHLSLMLMQHNRRHQAIFFNGAERKLPRPPWDVAFRIEANTYRGTTQLQLQIDSIRPVQN